MILVEWSPLRSMLAFSLVNSLSRRAPAATAAGSDGRSSRSVLASCHGRSLPVPTARVMKPYLAKMAR